ncbi:hypothetical protein IJ674_10305 [bacterium]|nr:hypothetical protein [bacterium]
MPFIHHTKEFKHKDIFEEYQKEIAKIPSTTYGKIFNFTKQNIWKRLKKDSYISLEEKSILVKHLEDINKTNTLLYKKLADKTTHVDIPIKSSVSASCGFGVDVYDESVKDCLSLPIHLLNHFNASKTSTEIIFAEGDSMLPEIKDNDMILVDKSKTDIQNNQTYVFSYDGQPMCKMLSIAKGEIIAISKNTKYPPFKIDTSLNFRIVGQVVGLFHSML